MKTDKTQVKSLRTVGAYAIAIILLAGLPAVRSGSQLTLLLLSLVALAAAAAPIYLRKQYSLLEPPTALTMLVFFGVALKMPYILWFWKSRPFVSERLLQGCSPDILIHGTLTIALAFTFVTLGYLVPIRVRTGPLFLGKFTSWSRSRLLFVTMSLVAVSLVFTFLFIRSVGASFGSFDQLSGKRFAEEGTGSSGRIHTVSYLYYRIAALSKFAYLLVVAYLLRHKRRIVSIEGLIALAAGAQLVLLYIVLQSRASIVLLGLDTLVISILLIKRLPIVKVAVTVLAVFLLLTALLSVRMGRSHQTVHDLVEKTLVGRDLLDVSKTCHIINAIPKSMSYRYGETFIGWVFAPIPDSVWRDKPRWAKRGVTVTRYVYGEKHGLNSIEPGLVAETYWNFSWWGIPPVMFILGICLRALYETFSRDNHINGVLIYAIMLDRLAVFSFALSLGTGILKAGLDVIPLYLVLIFVGSVSKSPSSVASASLQTAKA